MSNILPEEWQTPTIYLALINIFFYIVTSIIGRNPITTGNNAIILFGLSIDGFSRGLIWTPITSVFVHGHIAHLGMNLIFLLIFGLRLEEKEFTDKSIYFAFIVTGVLSGLISMLILYSSTSVSIGSSGAVFGLLGVNIGNEKKRNDPNFKRILGFSLIIFMFSSISPGTNILAHLLGLIFGFLLGNSDYYYSLTGEDYSKFK